MKLHLVSLGCAKNLVDSEIMLGRLKTAGWTITEAPEKADTIIVNTCSFIESAINESIDTILELAKFKSIGACRHLVVSGCLPERFRDEIVQTLPEVDLFLGTGAFDKIETALENADEHRKCLLTDPSLITLPRHDAPRLRTSLHTAYVKISEGCSRRCTYCIIPKLRGRQRSRLFEDIILEARSLIASGANELILIAQDTTSYGKDLSPPADFAQLLKDISELSEAVWLRFLYGHPESINDEIIKTVARHPNICSYFDIPIQHVSKNVLKRMGRNCSGDDLVRLIDKIRSMDPDASLRTTVMVGFPGETEKDFKALLSFVEEVHFDHLGVFVYSDFNDLPSHHLSGHVPVSVAKERHDLLMSRQKEISLKQNRRHIGRVYKVIPETEIEENLFCGRTFFQAPEVDGLTYVRSRNLDIGRFVSVRIDDALEYDLIGEAI